MAVRLSPSQCIFHDLRKSRHCVQLPAFFTHRWITLDSGGPPSWRRHGQQGIKQISVVKRRNVLCKVVQELYRVCET